jgi:hypothetical protein
MLILSPAAYAQQTTSRGLTGTVTDEHHKPIAGAVVQVQNEDTKTVESAVTDRVGHYVFRRLSANTDYSVWARDQQHQSKAHEISKFNSKNPVVEDLEVKVK